MRRLGFTLLEVVVALAILSLTLMAIFDINAGAIANHAYTKRLTVATLLARSKMIDLEQQLHDKGFSADDDDDSGDFSDEGWPSFKWRARIIAPKTQGLSPQQLIAALFNVPMGEDAGDLGPLSALFGGGKDSKDKGPAGQSPLAALGPAASLAQGQFTQMVDQLTKAVREVHLTVTWKDGKNTESLDLVTHVVSLGVGSDRNGGARLAQQAAATGTAASDPWVRQDNGAVVSNPRPNPQGGMVDPADGSPLVPQSQWLASRGGQSAIPSPVSPFGGRGVPQMVPQGMGNVLPQRPPIINPNLLR